MNNRQRVLNKFQTVRFNSPFDGKVYKIYCCWVKRKASGTADQQMRWQAAKE
jgi:hypothetical protein